MQMRVFHFVNTEHGLDDLRRRRLKVATLNELNDPFELFGVSLRDARLRHVLQTLKEKLELESLGCFALVVIGIIRFYGATMRHDIRDSVSASTYQTITCTWSATRADA